MPRKEHEGELKLRPVVQTTKWGFTAGRGGRPTPTVHLPARSSACGPRASPVVMETPWVAPSCHSQMLALNLGPCPLPVALLSLFLITGGPCGRLEPALGPLEPW